MIEYKLLPGILPEDIRQDIAISRLTGRKSSMKKLKEGKDIGYGLHPSPDAIPIWSIVPRPDFKLFEQLAEFVLNQEELIKQRIVEYLSEPDEGKLQAVVIALGKDLEEKKVPLTLTELIFKSLPATLDELYELAIKVHISRKPQAAVRQNIRNLISRGRVQWEDDVLCRVSDSQKQRS